MLNDNMGSPNNKSIDKIAEAIANAYNLSCVGFCNTLFGAKLISGNTNELKKAISDGLTLNSKFQTRKKIAFIKIAKGFAAYWSDSKFTLVPPLPPAVSPNLSSNNPGVYIAPNIFIFKLSDDLFKLWGRLNKDSFDNFINEFYTILLAFHATLQGFYNGVIYTPPIPTPIPLVLPWIGIFG